MRSLNNAICTSGEPVSFTCARYCSINIDLASLKSSSPPNPFKCALVLSFSSTVGGYHTRSIPCKIFLHKIRVRTDPYCREGAPVFDLPKALKHRRGAQTSVCVLVFSAVRLAQNPRKNHTG